MNTVCGESAGPGAGVGWWDGRLVGWWAASGQSAASRSMSAATASSATAKTLKRTAGQLAGQAFAVPGAEYGRAGEGRDDGPVDPAFVGQSGYQGGSGVGGDHQQAGADRLRHRQGQDGDQGGHGEEPAADAEESGDRAQAEARRRAPAGARRAGRARAESGSEQTPGGGSRQDCEGRGQQRSGDGRGQRAGRSRAAAGSPAIAKSDPVRQRTRPAPAWTSSPASEVTATMSRAAVVACPGEKPSR